ncbi:unnamed protein product [Peronospora farinosa]|uniref:Uncharacterized protein n=1 Tax=Peronospora farinosa TaxID=134698 RepID=A0AAV0TLQ1_9STRA|nr:unnamed protein product [Peronospora farinosa]
MPPKRDEADGVPAKTSMQTRTKQENTGPSHDGADENLSLIVDYNESTRLPSPQSGDEHSALMVHLSPSFEVLNLQEAFMLPDSEGHASSSAPTSAAITNERAASNETAATQQQVGDSKLSASVNPTSAVLSIHNGESDSGEGEQKSYSTSRSTSLARRRKGGYASDGLPPMSPPSKWSRSSGTSATLLKSVPLLTIKTIQRLSIIEKAGQSTRSCFYYPRCVAF